MPERLPYDKRDGRRLALVEQLGSVNAAAPQLGTARPSLRKAFQRHGFRMPSRNPEAVRQRAIDAARQRSGQPATPTRCSWRSIQVPSRPGAGRRPRCTSGFVAWAIIRRANRSHRLTGQRASRPDRRDADRADRPSRSHQPQEREIVADVR
jgi:hypothetical protein